MVTIGEFEHFYESGRKPNSGLSILSRKGHMFGNQKDLNKSKISQAGLGVKHSDATDGTAGIEWKVIGRPQAKVGDKFFFGNYRQDNGVVDSKQAIVWRVLSVENDRMLLIAEQGIDCKQYNEFNQEVTWESCSLRQWLNNDFINAAFSVEEQESIAMTILENPFKLKYHASGGSSTQDRVFLLSFSEVYDYLTTPNLKHAKATAYAIQKGAYVNTNGNSWWWLRSPGNGWNNATVVYDDGMIDKDGLTITYDNIAIRPALYLNL